MIIPIPSGVHYFLNTIKITTKENCGSGTPGGQVIFEGRF
jgi:hypothetical protein